MKIVFYDENNKRIPENDTYHLFIDNLGNICSVDDEASYEKTVSEKSVGLCLCYELKPYEKYRFEVIDNKKN